MVSCIQCKGRMLCHRDFCPVYTKARALFKVNENLKELFDSNSPPSVFVGRSGYPEVNVGILSPVQRIDDAFMYENPEYWYKNNFTIQKIVELRSSLINSRFKARVQDVRTNSRFIEVAQEIAMTQKPVDIEVNLKKKPEVNPNFEKVTMPFGINAPLKDIKLTENPSINNKIEKVFSDNDLKATEAINYLYKNEFNENILSQLLSIGIFGLKKNRRLVSTRWSITATDDTIGKELLKQIRYYDQIGEHQLFYGNYFGNYYIIMLFPDVFSYELFEGYLPGALWNFTGKIEFSTDYESFYGRKNYADNTAGGYYAARLPLLEYFTRIKKQASCLVIRFETPEYSAPLGVWVVRVAARKTLTEIPIVFENKRSMLNKANEIIKNMFNYDMNDVLINSKLLKGLEQSRLNRFFPSNQ